jgi:hypothetical protein
MSIGSSAAAEHEIAERTKTTLELKAFVFAGRSFRNGRRRHCRIPA